MPDTQHLAPKLTTFIITTGVPFQCVDTTTWFYESRSRVAQAGLELLPILLLLPPSANVIDVYPTPSRCSNSLTGADDGLHSA